LRHQLHQQLNDGVDGVSLNGHPINRLPGCLHLSFVGIDGTKMLMELKDVAVSAGAACTSGSNVVSHVLEAVGMDNTLAFSSLRFGLGRFTTSEEIEYVGNRVQETVERVRSDENLLAVRA
jgi:cysteine desulfurase